MNWIKANLWAIAPVLIVLVGLIVVAGMFFPKKQTVVVASPASPASVASPEPPALAVVDTSSSVTAVTEDHQATSTTRVKVVIPANTVIGDSDLTVEVDQQTEVKDGKATVKKVAKKREVVQTPPEVKVVTVSKPERKLGIAVGAGYPNKPRRVCSVFTLWVKIWGRLGVQGGLVAHERLDAFVGPTVRIGDLLGIKIFAGAGLMTNRQGVVTLTLGF